MHEDLIEELIQTQCVKVGNFKLKSGINSKYYFNMKNIISYPHLIKKIGDAIYAKLDEFDIICGIPYGGLPIASYISTTYNKPMILMRDKTKEYGLQQRIEGNYLSTSRCVIIDDVITSGISMQEVIDYLQNEVNIVKCIVIFDRQQNYNCSLPIDSLLCKTDVVKYRLRTIKEEKKSDLCFAADLSDYDKLWSLIETIGNIIVICKIHYDAVDESYRNIFKDTINALSIKHNFLIMEDRKFNDISYIVKKQYKSLESWVDMVTVHTLVTPEVVKSLSGVLLVANMSNNDYDFSDRAVKLALENKTNVVGFISQKRLHNDFICMTPGISLENKKIDDQNHRSISEIDTDFKIIGRAIYNSNDLNSDIKKFYYKM